jgi:site-specific recombinase XerD
MERAAVEQLRFHDLQHTFASHLAIRGVPLETIGTLLGHKDPKLTKRYAHLLPASLRVAATRLHDLRMETKWEHPVETTTGQD